MDLPDLSQVRRSVVAMRDVYVAGIGMTRFAKQPERTLKDLTGEAVIAALKDSGATVADVQRCYFGNAVAGSMTGQEMLAGQFSLRPLGLGPIPVFNVENACASASSAFHLAWQDVATGLHDVVLAVAAEKMTHPDKARSFAAIGGSVDVATAPPDLPAGRSFLMDMYAESALRYMAASGATREDLAAVVVKNQRHGMHNPAAQYGAELSVAQVLSSREIVWPFTLQMCSPISDGAAAALLVSGDFTPATAGPGVSVLASAVTSAPADGSASVTSLAARTAYETAGLGPGDLDCVEVHDAAASAGPAAERPDHARRTVAGQHQRGTAGPRASHRRDRAGADRGGGHAAPGRRRAPASGGGPGGADPERRRLARQRQRGQCGAHLRSPRSVTVPALA
jgi:acetyl-CoA acetyltransferase